MATKTKLKAIFRYLQDVKVVSGFYQGHDGVVIDICAKNECYTVSLNEKYTTDKDYRQISFYASELEGLDEQST